MFGTNFSNLRKYLYGHGVNDALHNNVERVLYYVLVEIFVCPGFRTLPAEAGPFVVV